MYQNPVLNAPLGPDGLPIPVDPKKVQAFFEDFYEDVFEELAKYGEIEYLNVCDNLADHMVGNCYVKFRDEEAAARALQGLQGRYYAGKPIMVEFSPVTDFRESTCRQYEEGTCGRGGYCNFMHVRPVSRDLRKQLFGRFKGGSGGSTRFHDKPRERGGGGGGRYDDRRNSGYGGGGYGGGHDDRGRGRDRGGYGGDQRGGGGGRRESSAERRAKIAAWNQELGGGGGSAAPAAAPAAPAAYGGYAPPPAAAAGGYGAPAVAAAAGGYGAPAAAYAQAAAAAPNPYAQFLQQQQVPQPTGPQPNYGGGAPSFLPGGGTGANTAPIANPRWTFNGTGQ
ncbi:hypothetical protein N2152v2_000582 [Parachlorella kessleri]